MISDKFSQNTSTSKFSALYGVVAEFELPEKLLFAAQESYRSGYRSIDAYSPFPVEGLSEAIGFKGDCVASVTFFGGLIGGALGYFTQWYANVIDYPINSGGRPYHSWPAFIPVTFEMVILGAAICTALGMLIMNRLPQLHHPIFESPEFLRASQDRFFLCIEAKDPKFNLLEVEKFFSVFVPLSIRTIESNE